jgi:hypothetical protein
MPPQEVFEIPARLAVLEDQQAWYRYDENDKEAEPVHGQAHDEHVAGEKELTEKEGDDRSHSNSQEILDLQTHQSHVGS